MIDGSSGGKPDRHQQLAAAAYRRIARDGFEGLRTRDVAADVGVNIATLHYYFPTKEALIRGVIGHAMQRFRSTMPAQGRPLEQLRTHLRALMHLLRQDRELWTVMGELVLRAARDPDLARTFRDTDRYWHRQLRELIAACMSEGSVPHGLNAGEVATLMIVAIKGLSLPTSADFSPRSAEQVFRQFERLLGLEEDPELCPL